MSLYLAAMGFGLVLLVSTIFLGDSDLDFDTFLFFGSPPTPTRGYVAVGASFSQKNGTHIFESP